MMVQGRNRTKLLGSLSLTCRYLYSGSEPDYVSEPNPTGGRAKRAGTWEKSKNHTEAMEVMAEHKYYTYLGTMALSMECGSLYYRYIHSLSSPPPGDFAENVFYTTFFFLFPFVL